MYRITVKKVEEKEVIKREYEKIADTGNALDKGAMYGFVNYPSTEILETSVLIQEVEELDLSAVIKAVNNL